jgi:glycosyltransferase involved in cell wall biosynthesis
MTKSINGQKKLPIVYISPYYKTDDSSGGNRRFNQICKRFNQELGPSFTLVITKGQKPTWWNPKSNLVEIEYGFNHFTKLSAMKQIGTYLDSIPPSIVVLESIPIPFTSLKRHAHFQVAYDFRYFTGDSKSFLYRLLFSKYLRNQWKHAEFFVTPTDFSISELQKYVGYEKEKVIKSYFGIDKELLNASLLPKLEKKYDVIYVGHFEKRKNHAPLLHAIAITDPTLKVKLIGYDTGLQKKLEALARNLGLINTTFESVNDDTLLWQYYRESKVFVYPSIYEGFGIPTIEALVLGIPVICSNIPVFHEIGGDLVTYFNPREPKDIAKKLQRALEVQIVPSPERVRNHLQKFLWDKIYIQFENDLQRYASKKFFDK